MDLVGWRLFIVLAACLASAQASVCSYKSSVRYTEGCGFWGWARCTMYRYTTTYGCCTGWSGSTSSGCSTPTCYPYCTNGGRCTSPNYCSGCNRGYYSPRCNQCTSIAHCLDVYCTTSTNQQCGSCDGDYGPSLGSAYKLSSDQRQCLKQCSWRTDSNACYPGDCTDGQCTCISGFSGTDCRTMGASQEPVISAYRATLINGATEVDSPAEQGSEGTVYSDMTNVTSIRVVWQAAYEPVGLPDLTSTGRPYIHSANISLVSTSARVFVQLAEGDTYSLGSHDCRTGTILGPASCEFTVTINGSEWAPATGDVLRCDIEATSGGYLKLYDRDRSSRIITRYFSGRTAYVSPTFTFALDGPYHCVNVSSGCRATMLDAGSDVTTEPELTITWEDWADDHAGIKEYYLEVHQLSATSGGEMTEIFDRPAVFSNVTESGQNVTLPHAGVYSVVLSVIDNLGNVRLSRRLVLFDDDPDDVTVMKDFPMRVLSASQETNYQWLTNFDPDEGNTSLCLDWSGHFMNRRHHDEGWLRPVGPYVHEVIDFDYDQHFGQRGRAAIPNTLGVTQFAVMYEVNHGFGNGSAANDTIFDCWSDEGTNTRASYDVTLMDGDSIQFWVEASDVAGHSTEDSVLIRADASPPVLDDMMMIVDQYGIGVTFVAFDVHSGVRSIQWRLFDNYTGIELEIDNDTLTIENIGNETVGCSPATCKCVQGVGCQTIAYQLKTLFSEAFHCRDYFVTLTVTNHAGLKTNKTIKTTVTQENVGRVTETIASLTSDTASMDSGSVVTMVDLMDCIVDMQDTSTEVTANVVRVVSNLLQLEDQLGKTDLTANTSSRLIKSLEGQISCALASGENFTEVMDNLAVVGRTFPPSSLTAGVGFAATAGENGTESLTQDQIRVYGRKSGIPMKEVTASITLPATMFDTFTAGDLISVSFIVYQSSKLFRSALIEASRLTDLPSYVDSWIIAASVEGTHVQGLPAESPVVINFLQDQGTNSQNRDRETTECVFWDFSLRDGFGDWSTEGCKKGTPVGGRTVCQCDHTTNFAVLVKTLSPKNVASSSDSGVFIIGKIGCGVSIAALVITMCVYLVVRPLRASTAGRILVSFCCSLLLLYTVLLAGMDQTSSRVGCIVSAVLTHYFSLSSAAWMSVEAAHLYLADVCVAGMKWFMIKASIAAWGMPVLVVTLVLVTDYTAYENTNSCVLKPGAALYCGELLVIGLVLLFNATVFVLVLRKVVRSASKPRSQSKESTKTSITGRLKNMVTVAVLFGLAWASGLLSVHNLASVPLQVLFGVLSSLLGVSICLLFVLQQSKIREYSFARKRQSDKSHASTSTGGQPGGPSVRFRRDNGIPARRKSEDADSWYETVCASADDRNGSDSATCGEAAAGQAPCSADNDYEVYPPQDREECRESCYEDVPTGNDKNYGSASACGEKVKIADFPFDADNDYKSYLFQFANDYEDVGNW